jgi:hypothetical protein
VHRADAVGDVPAAAGRAVSWALCEISVIDAPLCPVPAATVATCDTLSAEALSVPARLAAVSAAADMSPPPPRRPLVAVFN